MSSSVRFLTRCCFVDGKLSQTALENAVFHSMPGSTKLEREVYEQYIILQKGGPKGGQIINAVNPMGGRMETYNSMITEVIEKYGLPK